MYNCNNNKVVTFTFIIICSHSKKGHKKRLKKMIQQKNMLPENPLKHEMKLLKFEHNKLKNTQVDDKTYYNIIHLKT